MAYETINPSTGERVATFPLHTAAEVEQALATRRRPLPFRLVPGRHRTPTEGAGVACPS